MSSERLFQRDGYEPLTLISTTVGLELRRWTRLEYRITEAFYRELLDDPAKREHLMERMRLMRAGYAAEHDAEVVGVTWTDDWWIGNLEPDRETPEDRKAMQLDW